MTGPLSSPIKNGTCEGQDDLPDLGKLRAQHVQRKHVLTTFDDLLLRRPRTAFAASLDGLCVSRSKSHCSYAT